MSPRGIYVQGLEHGPNPIPSAARRGPLVATSNVFGRHIEDGTRPGAVDEEFRLAFGNLRIILEAAEAEMTDVVKIEIRLAASTDRDLLNQLWVDVFADADERPARHVTIGEVPAGFRLQLSALAFAT